MATTTLRYSIPLGTNTSSKRALTHGRRTTQQHLTTRCCQNRNTAQRDQKSATATSTTESREHHNKCTNHISIEYHKQEWQTQRQGKYRKGQGYGGYGNYNHHNNHKGGKGNQYDQAVGQGNSRDKDMTKGKDTTTKDRTKQKGTTTTKQAKEQKETMQQTLATGADNLDTQIGDLQLRRWHFDTNDPTND